MIEEKTKPDPYIVSKVMADIIAKRDGIKITIKQFKGGK